MVSETISITATEKRILHTLDRHLLSDLYDINLEAGLYSLRDAARDLANLLEKGVVHTSLCSRIPVNTFNHLGKTEDIIRSAAFYTAWSSTVSSEKKRSSEAYTETVLRALRAYEQTAID